jgi:hypothetical protein
MTVADLENSRPALRRPDRDNSGHGNPPRPALSKSMKGTWKMAHSTIDPWIETLTAAGGIEGLHLKCAKGAWCLDGVQIAVGEDGLKLAVIMPSAAHGAVLWRDQEIVDRTPLRRYEDAAASGDIEEEWCPYTQFLAVGADEKHRGQLMTFTSSSWSGRHAFRALIGPYLRKGKREFPVVTLGSKPRRNDPNNNVDPTFTIIDWAMRDGFTDLLLPEADERPQLEAPPTAPAIQRPMARMTVTTGPQPAPSAENDGYFPGADPAEDIPF